MMKWEGKYRLITVPLYIASSWDSLLRTGWTVLIEVGVILINPSIYYLRSFIL